MADAQGQLDQRAPSESSGQVPCCGTGHPGLAEGWWLGSIALAEQLKKKGSRKEGEAERGSQRERERERERDSAAQGMLLMPVGTCTW